MVRKILGVISVIASLAALYTASTACSFIWYQPRTPKCLLK